MAEKLNSLSPSSQMTLGLMITLLTMMGSGIWQFATMSGRIDYLERKISDLQETSVRKDVITTEVNAIREQLSTQSILLQDIQKALTKPGR